MGEITVKTLELAPAQVIEMVHHALYPRFVAYRAQSALYCPCKGEGVWDLPHMVIDGG